MRYHAARVPPKTLGNYEVGVKIARGGMAAVHLGKRIGTGELAALKIIEGEYAQDPRFYEMFVDEARILQRLSHPKVIATYECGTSPDECYIAMELLLGHSLADVFERLALVEKRMAPELVAWIGRETADGLHHAHELEDETGQSLELIHRDVNPSNIFLTYDGQVKLIDFGLARAQKRLSRSAEGIIKGKVPYFSPEQVAGAGIDRRVDIYSLGATLWETITQTRLFKRENDLLTIRAIQEAHIPDARELVPGVPDALWAVVAKALAPDRERRHPTALALADELHRWLADTPGGTNLRDRQLADFLEELYPGARERQERWLRDARHQAPGDRHTLLPPSALPAMGQTD